MTNAGITPTQNNVIGFINDAMQSPYQSPSEENTKAAAAFLFELVQAAKYGDSWNPFKKRIGVKKISDAKFDPRYVTVDSPELGIVVDYLDGKIKYEVAVLLLGEMHDAKETSAKGWINAMKSQAQKFIAFRDNFNTEVHL